VYKFTALSTHRDVNGRIVKRQKTHNLMTVEGATYLLNMFFLTEPLETFVGQVFFFFYINAAGFTAISRLDTAASHPWVEFKDYTTPSALRVAWGGTSIDGPDRVSRGSTLTRTITATSAAAVQGFGLIPSSNKALFPFPLLTVAEYNAPFNLSIGETLDTTYDIRLIDGTP